VIATTFTGDIVTYPSEMKKYSSQRFNREDQPINWFFMSTLVNMKGSEWLNAIKLLDSIRVGGSS